jgi:MoaA/NifB/PqqE/SkfB family radical SAM enzyme
MRYDFLEFQENNSKEIYSDVNAFEYRYADLRFRNTCNYACVYCGPLCSSLWAEELNQHDALGKDKIDDLIQYYLDNISKINYLYIAGGEPLLIKENQIILDKLAEVNLNCNISVNTNLSLIKNNKIYETLLKFKSCHWIVSFDDMEDRYNYIRYPGNWNNFYSNLLLLKNAVGVDNISFSMTYTSLNAKTIFQAIKTLTKEGFEKNCFNIYYVHAGQKKDFLDPRSLPQTYIDETVSIIKQNLIDNNTPLYNSKDERYNNQLNTLISFLNNNSNYKSTLLQDLQILDQRRNLDSKKIFPDIYNSFN